MHGKVKKFVSPPHISKGTTISRVSGHWGMIYGIADTWFSNSEAILGSTAFFVGPDKSRFRRVISNWPSRSPRPRQLTINPLLIVQEASRSAALALPLARSQGLYSHVRHRPSHHGGPSAAVHGRLHLLVYAYIRSLAATKIRPLTTMGVWKFCTRLICSS